MNVSNLLDVARKYLGIKEGGKEHQHILDVYNSTTPLARGYKVQKNDSWCATFVSFVAIEAGVPDLFGRECGVEKFVEIFKSKGIWIEDGTIKPNIGDIIVYNWDSPVQPNNGYADHIGFVENVSSYNVITTIEGNKNDKVERRTIQVGDGTIRGYARPTYTGQPITTPKPAPTTVKTGNDNIRKVQQWIKNNYFNMSVDGYTGVNTRKGLAYAMQTEMVRQWGVSIRIDGYFQDASQGAFATIRKGAQGNMTKIVQGALICLGYSVNGFDGIFGGGLENAVKQFQRDNGLSVDGVVGRNTARKLFDR